MEIEKEQVEARVAQVKPTNKRQYEPNYKAMNFVGRKSIEEHGRALCHDLYYGRTMLGKRRWIVCRKCYKHHSAIALRQEKCVLKPDQKPGSRTKGAWKKWRLQPNIEEDLTQMGTNITKLDKIFGSTRR